MASVLAVIRTSLRGWRPQVREGSNETLLAAILRARATSPMPHLKHRVRENFEREAELIFQL